MDGEYSNAGTTIDGGGSPDRGKENRENVVVGGDSLVRWCQGLQERAIRRELETEKFGITNRERAYFRKIFGYSDDEKGKKKDLSNAGGYTIEALNLHQEVDVEKQHDKEINNIRSAIQIDGDEHQQGKTELGSLPSIFTQVGE